jgi:hypothetical protein
MEAAFFLIRLLPPPSAGADVFAGLYRAGAGLAADGGIASVMQRVVWYSVATDVVPDIVFRPIREWIEFLHAVRGIVLLNRQVVTRARLRAALTGNPCFVAG